MAAIPGTVGVTGIIAPTDELDEYPVTEDIYNKGGFRAVADVAARDLITILRRSEGMLVEVVSTNTTYQLVGGITNSDWSEYNSSSISSNLVSIASGEALSGGRIVFSDGNEAFYSDNAVASSMSKAIGITTGASALGALASIQIDGEFIEPTWTWTSGPIYNGTDGLLTQSVPTNGFVLQVATAISATKILINIKQGILRI